LLLVDADNMQTDVNSREERSHEITSSNTNIPENNNKNKQFSTTIQDVDEIESGSNSDQYTEMFTVNKHENRQKPRRFDDFIM